MPKLALWPYPHIKRKPKVPEPATKEDITKLIHRLEVISRIKLLSTRSRHQLLKKLRKEGKI